MSLWLNWDRTLPSVARRRRLSYVTDEGDLRNVELWIVPHRKHTGYLDMMLNVTNDVQ